MSSMKSVHYRDDFDNPKGGFAGGPGIAITWNDVEGAEDGADVSDVVAAALDRLIFLAPHRPSNNKEHAINHLRLALKELAADRVGRMM